MATPYTESARSVLSALKALSIPEDKRALIERGITELDQELHELHTGMAQPISVADMALPQLLPDLPAEYLPDLYTPFQRRTMALLLEVGERGISRDDIFEALGRDPGAPFHGRTAPVKQVDVIVSRCRQVLNKARKNLEAKGLPSYINPIFGRGYVLQSKPRPLTLSTEVSRRFKTGALTRQQVRVYERLKAAKGKPVSERELIDAACFRGGNVTPGHELLQRAVTRIRVKTGARIDRGPNHSYRLVTNG